MRMSSRFKVSLFALFVFAPLLALGAGGKAYVASNGLLQHVFRSTSYSAPANTYVGLFSTCPYAGFLGTELTSGTSAGYTRTAAIAKGDSSWSYTAATYIGAATIANTGAIAFPQNSSGTTAWVGACCFGVFDAPSAGNLLYWGPLTGPTQGGSGTCTSPIVVGAGATASFAVGQLTITEN
jgi:hypothetical protein